MLLVLSINPGCRLCVHLVALQSTVVSSAKLALLHQVPVMTLGELVFTAWVDAASIQWTTDLPS